MADEKPTSNRDARITEDFADGTYEFRLGYGAIRMLQEARDAGPLWLFGVLQSGTWKVEDIREVIRCGLIGGGMAPVAANKLVIAYVEERPPMENMALAIRVLGAGIVGAGDEPMGEDVAANLRGMTSGSTISPMAN
jgi:hypothetical protein